MKEENIKTKACSSCGAEIPKYANICPSCNTKQKKPFYKKWWFIAIVALIVLGSIGSALGGGGDDKTAATNTPSVSDDNTTSSGDVNAPADTSSEDAAVDEQTTDPVEDTPSATLGEQNALEQANNYLSMTAFSKKGLIEQLEYEGYSNSEASYAADNCGADWNEQAALKAKDYISMTAFSRQGLIEQLEFEGFTSSQARHGADAVGY